MEKCGIEHFKQNNHRRKKFHDETDEDFSIDTCPNTNFRINTYFVILDRLVSELKKRKVAYDQLLTKYTFIFQLTEMIVVEVKKKAEILQKEYKSDLGISFLNEIVHFRSHLKSLLKNNKYVPKRYNKC